MVGGQIASILSSILHTLRKSFLSYTNINFCHISNIFLVKEANSNVCEMMPKWYQKCPWNSQDMLYIKQVQIILPLHTCQEVHSIHQEFIPLCIMCTNCSGTKKTCEMVGQKSSAPWQAAIRPDDSVCSVIMSQVRRQPPFVPKPPSSTASKDDEWPHYMPAAISVSPNKSCFEHPSLLQLR